MYLSIEALNWKRDRKQDKLSHILYPDTLTDQRNWLALSLPEEVLMGQTFLNQHSDISLSFYHRHQDQNMRKNFKEFLCGTRECRADGVGDGKNSQVVQKTSTKVSRTSIRG